MDSISELLRTPVTHTRLTRWLTENQGILDHAGTAPPRAGAGSEPHRTDRSELHRRVHWEPDSGAGSEPYGRAGSEPETSL